MEETSLHCIALNNDSCQLGAFSLLSVTMVEMGERETNKAGWRNTMVEELIELMTACEFL